MKIYTNELDQLTNQDYHSMTISNISSKATGPIVTKSHLEPPEAEGTKLCSNEQYDHHTHIW